MFAMVSTAQTYMPVLSEGKVWRYATVNRYERTDTTGYYNVTVSGDTIVKHFVCKKILVQNDFSKQPDDLPSGCFLQLTKSSMGIQKTLPRI